MTVFKTVVVYKQATSCNLTISWEKQTSTINRSKKWYVQHDVVSMEDVKFQRVNYFISNYFKKIQSTYWKKTTPKSLQVASKTEKVYLSKSIIAFQV